MHFVKDKGFYKSLWMIVFPIAIQNLITFGINMMDTVMLGEFGDTIISAANLASQPFFIFTLLTYGIAGGSSVLASQYWGRGEVETVRKIIAIALRVAFLASILFSTVVLCFPQVIMQIYTDDPEIIRHGTDYLRIVGYIYLFFGISNTFVSVIRSMEIVVISVISNLITFVANVFFNWIFIFGELGAPALGIKGAAVGTLIARIIEFCVLMTYAFLIDKKLRFRLRYLLDWTATLWKD
ncbi:MAG: polysaccharide biosynthesis C-terminal domain-containing protein, partial [Oscillospiraceae bacterium]|nr:polysaccharide biosynthesis C-terminal domain-containing protein [Oscillospiraceae bacterium]